MPETGKSSTYRLSDGNHVKQLKEAFSSVASGTSDVSIISEDKQQIHSNRRFLSIFSSSLRDILRNIPEHVYPTLILPDCSSSSINNCLEIITGNSIQFDSRDSWSDMVNTANVLGIIIKEDSFINSDIKSEPMECDDNSSENISDNTDVLRESQVQETSNDKATDLNGDATNSDSGINSFLELSSSDSVVSSTPKQKQSSGLSDLYQNIIEATSNVGKDETPNNTSLQIDEIKQEIFNFDVSPKDLITKQADHKVCQIPDCAKAISTHASQQKLSQLMREHYVINHFWEEIVAKCSKFVDEVTCILCLKAFSTKNLCIKHVAIWHSKINEILTSKNYLPLPLQINIKDQPENDDQSLESVSNVLPARSAGGEHPTIENSDDKMKSFGEKTDFNEHSEVTNTSANGETSSSMNLKNNLVEPMTIMYDVIGSTNGETSQVKEEPLESVEADVEQESPQIKEPSREKEPEEVKKELFDFDQAIIPKEMIAEQSAHKLCQVCLKSEPIMTKLRDHYATHFMKEIEERYGKFVDDKSCTYCTPPKLLNSRHLVLRHIATWHSKVNSILTSKNLLPLPLTLNVKDTEQYVPREKLGPGQAVPFSSADGFHCQLCSQNQKSFSALRYHFYTKHFKTEVNSQFGHLADEKTGLICLICKKQQSSRTGNMNHIAIIHSKINEVIVGKGMEYLLSGTAVPERKALEETMVEDKSSSETLVAEKAPIKTLEESETREKDSSQTLDKRRGQTQSETLVVGTALSENLVGGTAMSQTLAGGQALGETFVGRKALSGTLAGGKGLNETLVGGKAVDKNLVGEKALDKNLVGEKALDKNLVGGKALDKNLVGEKALDKNLVGEKALDKNLVGEKALDKTLVGRKALDKTLVGGKALTETFVGGNVQSETFVGLKDPEKLPVRDNKDETLTSTQTSGKALTKKQMVDKIQMLISTPHNEMGKQNKELKESVKEKDKSEVLNEEFKKDNFLTNERTKLISETLSMSEKEVWEWFHMARTKKSEDNKVSNNSAAKPKAPKAILIPDNELTNAKNKQISEFSEQTELKLNKEFFLSKNLNKERTEKIAAKVKLSEEQVEKWFTERRTQKPAFTKDKLNRLNQEFSRSQDLPRQRSKTLAYQLGLNEKQIIQWFKTKVRSHMNSGPLINKTNEALQMPRNKTSIVSPNSQNESKYIATPAASDTKASIPQNCDNSTNPSPQTIVNKLFTSQSVVKSNNTLANVALKDSNGTPQSLNKNTVVGPQHFENLKSFVTKTNVPPQISVNKIGMNQKHFNNISVTSTINRINTLSQVELTPTSGLSRSDLTKTGIMSQIDLTNENDIPEASANKTNVTLHSSVNNSFVNKTHASLKPSANKTNGTPPSSVIKINGMQSSAVKKSNATTQPPSNKTKPMTQSSVNESKLRHQSSVNKTISNPQSSVNETKLRHQTSINKINSKPQLSVNKTNPKIQSSVINTKITHQYSTNINIQQLLRLEKEFGLNQLKTKEIRSQLASQINLTEKEVEQWLEQRIMVKKQLAKGADPSKIITAVNSSETKPAQNKRIAETDSNEEEPKRIKMEAAIANKVIKIENNLKPKIEENSEQRPKKAAYSCTCGESFLSDEAFEIHKSYTCKNLAVGALP